MEEKGGAEREWKREMEQWGRRERKKKTGRNKSNLLFRYMVSILLWKTGETALYLALPRNMVRLQRIPKGVSLVQLDLVFCMCHSVCTAVSVRNSMFCLLKARGKAGMCAVCTQGGSAGKSVTQGRDTGPLAVWHYGVALRCAA